MSFDLSRTLASIESVAAASPASFDQPLVLRDLSTGASIVLEGAALPERGLRGGVRQRATVSRYPGASEGSVQVMGTEDQPIEMNGVWRDDLLGRGGGTRELVAQFDAMVRAQNFVELTWGDALVVRGLLEEFIPEWGTEAEVRWRARLLVIQSEADTVESTAMPETPSSSSMASILELLGSIEADMAAAVALSTAAQAVLE